MRNPVLHFRVLLALIRLQGWEEVYPRKHLKTQAIAAGINPLTFSPMSAPHQFTFGCNLLGWSTVLNALSGGMSKPVTLLSYAEVERSG